MRSRALYFTKDTQESKAQLMSGIYLASAIVGSPAVVARTLHRVFVALPVV